MKNLQSLFLTLFLVSAFFSCEFVNQKKQKDSDEEKASVNEADYSKKDFYGHWRSNVSVIIDDEFDLIYEDNMYYHRGDGYNSEGTFTFRVSEESDFYPVFGREFSYEFVEAGKWDIDEDYLVFTSSDVKINDHESSYDYDEEQMEVYEIFKASLKEQFVKDMVSSYKILEKDYKKMVLEEENVGEIDEDMEYPEVVTYKRVD